MSTSVINPPLPSVYLVGKSRNDIVLDVLNEKFEGRIRNVRQPNGHGQRQRAGTWANDRAKNQRQKGRADTWTNGGPHDRDIESNSHTRNTRVDAETNNRRRGSDTTRKSYLPDHDKSRRSSINDTEGGRKQNRRGSRSSHKENDYEKDRKDSPINRTAQVECAPLELSEKLVNGSSSVQLPTTNKDTIKSKNKENESDQNHGKKARDASNNEERPRLGGRRMSKDNNKTNDKALDNELPNTDLKSVEETSDNGDTSESGDSSDSKKTDQEVFENDDDKRTEGGVDKDSEQQSEPERRSPNFDETIVKCIDIGRNELQCNLDTDISFSLDNGGGKNTSFVCLNVENGDSDSADDESCLSGGYYHRDMGPCEEDLSEADIACCMEGRFGKRCMPKYDNMIMDRAVQICNNDFDAQILKDTYVYTSYLNNDWCFKDEIFVSRSFENRPPEIEHILSLAVSEMHRDALIEKFDKGVPIKGGLYVRCAGQENDSDGKE